MVHAFSLHEAAECAGVGGEPGDRDADVVVDLIPARQVGAMIGLHVRTEGQQH